jgi:hypothetical protein
MPSRRLPPLDLQTLTDKVARLETDARLRAEEQLASRRRHDEAVTALAELQRDLRSSVARLEGSLETARKDQQQRDEAMRGELQAARAELAGLSALAAGLQRGHEQLQTMERDAAADRATAAHAANQLASMERGLQSTEQLAGESARTLAAMHGDVSGLQQRHVALASRVATEHSGQSAATAELREGVEDALTELRAVETELLALRGQSSAMEQQGERMRRTVRRHDNVLGGLEQREATRSTESRATTTQMQAQLERLMITIQQWETGLTSIGSSLADRHHDEPYLSPAGAMSDAQLLGSLSAGRSSAGRGASPHLGGRGSI